MRRALLMVALVVASVWMMRGDTPAGGAGGPLPANEFDLRGPGQTPSLTSFDTPWRPVPTTGGRPDPGPFQGGYYRPYATCQPDYGPGHFGPLGRPPIAFPQPGPIKFFGIDAGRRAVRVGYVIDVDALRADAAGHLRAELLASIDRLTSLQDFAVVFASTRPIPFFVGKPDQAGYLRATLENRDGLKELAGICASSQPADSSMGPAVAKAFELPGGPPEVLFILTGGTLARDGLAAIRLLNKDRRTRINTIAFIGRDGATVLERVAQANGGVFRHLAAGDLGKDYGTIASPPASAPASTTGPPASPPASATGPPASQPQAGPVKFFGLSDQAARVAFVIDKSGSMAATFEYVREELGRAIDNLGERQAFAVVLFSDGPPAVCPLNAKGGFVLASKSDKRAFRDWLAKQVCYSECGATLPAAAIKAAFELPGGPPDVVYILTDGLFPPRETIDLLAKLSKDKKTRVNTIAFVDRVGEELLKQIARDTGGRYLFVKEDDLGRDYDKLMPTTSRD